MSPTSGTSTTQRGRGRLRKQPGVEATDRRLPSATFTASPLASTLVQPLSTINPSTSTVTTQASTVTSTASTVPSTTAGPSQSLFFQVDQCDDVTQDRFRGPAGPNARFMPKMLARCVTPKDFFEAMLPLQYFESIVRKLTSAQLEVSCVESLLFDEFQAYLAYWFAMSLITVEQRQDFWKQSNDFLSPAHNFGQFGISRKRVRSSRRLYVFQMSNPRGRFCVCFSQTDKSSSLEGSTLSSSLSSDVATGPPKCLEKN